MLDLLQKIDTSDIDQEMHRRREEAVQQLFREIVNRVEMLVDSGNVSSSKLTDGSIVKYVGFGAGEMPSFSRVFPFGENSNICKVESPIYKEQSNVMLKQLQQLAMERKIKIYTNESHSVRVVYYIPKEGER